MAKGPISPRHFQLMGQLKGSSEPEAAVTFSFLIRGLLHIMLVETPGYLRISLNPATRFT